MVLPLTALQENVQWRQGDCKRNSIAALTQHLYPVHLTLGKDIQNQLEMQKEKGFNWDSFPPVFKYGAFIKTVFYNKSYTHNGEAGVALRKKANIYSFDLASLDNETTCDWLLSPVLSTNQSVGYHQVVLTENSQPDSTEPTYTTH